MSVDIVMPEMGESITEGQIAKWLKEPGERVERDEAVLEITTDKIDSEIPSPADGILREILFQEGDTVEVGTVLARIEEGETSETAVPQTKAAPMSADDRSSQEVAEPHAAKLSPVARNIAKAEGLSDDELSAIEGSGREGKLTKTDLLKYIEKREETPAESGPEASPGVQEAGSGDGIEIVEMSTMRKMIAERMVASKRTSPHTYTVAEVDMTPLVDFRERIKRQFSQNHGFKITYTHFIIHATVQALKAFPLMNSSVEGDKIIKRRYVNLGVAVALDSGLIVPVIKNADEKNLLGLARAAHDLALRGQKKKLMPDDVQGGTFTITNPGVFGNIFGLPIINQPQVGILGVGAIKKRPVVINDAIAIRSIMYLSLSYDHRIIDGAVAAQFVQEIRNGLENFDVEQSL